MNFQTALILWILFPALSIGASCPKCPTNGIWSEWITVEKCEKDCGACSTITYTRTCLSLETDLTCNCTGSPTIKKPCNTQACNFPRANSPTKPCCDGSTPVLFNNWYHCGKVEELSGPTTSYCCPDGGIWGEWTGWTKVENKVEFHRTRTCVSGEYGCKCDGLARETKFECPCPPLLQLNITKDCPNVSASYIHIPGGHQYHASTCKATVVLEASNFRQDTLVLSGNAANDQVTRMVFLQKGKECDNSRHQVHKRTYSTKNGELSLWDFDCNLETGLWEGYNEWPQKFIGNLIAISQVYDWKT